MCEASVFLLREGREELVMEKVDRVIPGADDMIVLESIFGERKLVKARIAEMELVHHRILLEEVIETVRPATDDEIWLDLATDHGHFHSGDSVRLNLFKGRNMRPAAIGTLTDPEVFVVKEGDTDAVHCHAHEGSLTIDLGQEADGLLTVYAREAGERELFAKIIVEIGHHHHHGLSPAGLGLEIVPASYSHVHLGDNYEVQVLKDGKPFAGAEVLATYSSHKGGQYPIRLVTDAEGRARVLLSARGNWLFSVTDEKITSTFTLIKSF